MKDFLALLFFFSPFIAFIGGVIVIGWQEREHPNDIFER